MKRKHLSLFACLSLVLICSSCSDSGICKHGNGEIETTEFDLSSFNAVSLSDRADVVIKQGDTQRITVTGDANIIDALQTDIRNNEWDIELENGCYRDYQLDIEITVPDITKVNVNGSGSVYVLAFNDQPNLDLVVSGSGTIELERFRDTKNLDVSISGSGDVIGYDQFDALSNLDIRISGSGNYDAYPIETKNADINITGSGNCYTTVNNTLNVTISGSGRVRYHGTPSVKKSITGSGTVRKTD